MIKKYLAVVLSVSLSSLSVVYLFTQFIAPSLNKKEDIVMARKPLTTAKESSPLFVEVPNEVSFDLLEMQGQDSVKIRFSLKERAKDATSLFFYFKNENENNRLLWSQLKHEVDWLQNGLEVSFEKGKDLASKDYTIPRLVSLSSDLTLQINMKKKDGYFFEPDYLTVSANLSDVLSIGGDLENLVVIQKDNKLGQRLIMRPYGSLKFYMHLQSTLESYLPIQFISSGGLNQLLFKTENDEFFHLQNNSVKKIESETLDFQKIELVEKGGGGISNEGHFYYFEKGGDFKKLNVHETFTDLSTIETIGYFLLTSDGSLYLFKFDHSYRKINFNSPVVNIGGGKTAGYALTQDGWLWSYGNILGFSRIAKMSADDIRFIVEVGTSIMVINHNGERELLKTQLRNSRRHFSSKGLLAPLPKPVLKVTRSRFAGQHVCYLLESSEVYCGLRFFERVAH